MNDELEIGNVEMQDDGRNEIVTIELRNHTGRTLHVYADPRNIHYDPAARKLTVRMTDREAVEPTHSILRRPNLRAVDPKGFTTLRLTLPRIVNRTAPDAERRTTWFPPAPVVRHVSRDPAAAMAGGERSPEFEKLNIFEAETVEVQIAWSDRPFYTDPRPRKAQRTPRQELVAWQKGLAIGRGSRKGGAAQP